MKIVKVIIILLTTVSGLYGYKLLGEGDWKSFLILTCTPGLIALVVLGIRFWYIEKTNGWDKYFNDRDKHK